MAVNPSTRYHDAVEILKDAEDHLGYKIDDKEETICRELFIIKCCEIAVKHGNIVERVSNKMIGRVVSWML